MNTINVLLVENIPALKPMLERSLKGIKNERFKVASVDTRLAGVNFHFAKRQNDVLLLGEKIPNATALRLAKSYRAQGHAGHVIILTKQSEARLSPQMTRAGIDDILNVMEVETPVFGWTFMSALQTVGVKKKAQEYEDIHHRLQLVNNALEHITRNMSVPMATLHEVSRELQKNGHSKAKPTSLKKDLAENVAVLDQYLKELVDVRARLGKETKVINKYLALQAR